MDDVTVVIVEDTAASKFFHVPKYRIHTRCTNCGSITAIEQESDSESLPDDVRNAVGYAKIGVCTGCQKKLIVGFKSTSTRAHRNNLASYQYRSHLGNDDIDDTQLYYSKRSTGTSLEN